MRANSETPYRFMREPPRRNFETVRNIRERVTAQTTERLAERYAALWKKPSAGLKLSEAVFQNDLTRHFYHLASLGITRTEADVRATQNKLSSDIRKRLQDTDPQILTSERETQTGRKIRFADALTFSLAGVINTLKAINLLERENAKVGESAVIGINDRLDAEFQIDLIRVGGAQGEPHEVGFYQVKSAAEKIDEFRILRDHAAFIQSLATPVSAETALARERAEAMARAEAEMYSDKPAEATQRYQALIEQLIRNPSRIPETLSEAKGHAVALLNLIFRRSEITEAVVRDALVKYYLKEMGDVTTEEVLDLVMEDTKKLAWQITEWARVRVPEREELLAIMPDFALERDIILRDARFQSFLIQVPKTGSPILAKLTP